MNEYPEQHETRFDEKGRYEKVCVHCGQPFRTNNPRTLYHSEECKAAAAFARYYAKPEKKARIIQRVIVTRKENSTDSE